MTKIQTEKRKRDNLYARGSCISQVIGEFLSWETLRILSPGGSWEAEAGVSHIGKLCERLHPPLSRELSRVPVVHKSLPAVKVKWFSSESPRLCSGQNSIGLQTNCSSLSQKQEITISWQVGSAHSDRQCCCSPAAMCLQELTGSRSSLWWSYECTLPSTPAGGMMTSWGKE